MNDNYLFSQEYQKILEDTANHYKLLIKETIPYIQDFIHLATANGARGYHSETQGKVVYMEELGNLLNDLKQYSYGTRKYK